MTNQVQEVLNNCTVGPNNTVKLPEGQLDRKTYEAVAAKLHGIGGAWKSGKTAGFVFQHDPTERLAQIQAGEKVNLKKDFQFFETPDQLADQMVDLAKISDNDRVLEPSAGRGAIIRAIRRVSEKCHISAVELMPENAAYLSGKKLVWSIVFDHDDFLSWGGGSKLYTKIIANPPFSNNQDIDHVRRMYDFLAREGRMVVVVSRHWQLSNNKKETDFRQWLDSLDVRIIEVGNGAFKVSGTNVAISILVIDK